MNDDQVMSKTKEILKEVYEMVSKLIEDLNIKARNT